MKKHFFPYYISRALLSAVAAILVMGFNWKALVLGVVLFGFFLLYLHSGWFRVDQDNPLLPLRRDDRGRQIQRKALIIAILFGLITYFSVSQQFSIFDVAVASGNVSLAMAIIAYFTSQFVLFAKT